MRLVVGLGNPGAEYKFTRHNFGFMVVDELAAKHKKKFSKCDTTALTLSLTFAGEELILVKPQTYMNLSGRAVEALVRKNQLGNKDLIVIYDELDLPLGKIRIKERGSSGGHNGLQSIIDVLQTEEFLRIRLGISEGQTKVEDTHEFLFSGFDESNKETVSQVIERAINALEVLLREGAAKAMSVFN